MTLKTAAASLVLVEPCEERGTEQRGKAVRQSKGQDSGSPEPRMLSV